MSSEVRLYVIAVAACLVRIAELEAWIVAHVTEYHHANSATMASAAEIVPAMEAT